MQIFWYCVFGWFLVWLGWGGRVWRWYFDVVGEEVAHRREGKVTGI